MDGSDPGPAFWSALFLLLVLIDMLMAAYGSALQDTPENALEERERTGDEKAGRVHALKEAPEPFIHAIWLYLIATCGCAFGALRRLPGQRALAGALGAAALVYVLGEALPKMLGRKHARRVVFRLYAPARFLTLAVFPFTWLLDRCAMAAAFLLGIRKGDLEDEVTEGEIIDLVNEGHEQGVLDEHEAEMIQNIFRLDDKQAQDIMTHRKNITGISEQTSLLEAVTFMARAANSRFPVYRETIDDITGILLLKDAMLFHSRGDLDARPVGEIPGLLRPVSVIPETRSIDELFRTMQAQKLQMVIVVDEYGETAGLVTMEDILEEIVGNIQDEYDKEENNITSIGPGVWRLAGLTPLEEVEQTLGVELDVEDYETLNGFLVSRLDRIPEESDRDRQIPYSGWIFTIREIDGRMIQYADAEKDTENRADEGPAEHEHKE